MNLPAHKLSVLETLAVQLTTFASKDLGPLAAGVFGGYLAVTALLITLAITRHDEMIPLSRSIAGRYHKGFAAWAVAAFLFALVSQSWSTQLTVELALFGQAVSLLILFRLLWAAIGAAITPRTYEVMALKMAKRDVESRMRLAFATYFRPNSPSSIRHKVTVDSICRMNPRMKPIVSRKDGIVAYRAFWAWLFDRAQRHLDVPEKKGWLAQDSGTIVRTGDVMRVAIPSSFMNCVGALALKVLPFDLDYWKDLRLMGVTSYLSDNHLTFERSVELFIAGMRTLGELHDGGGATYADMWPAIGCPEAFQIGHEFETMAKSIIRSQVKSAPYDAGDLVLRLVGLAMEQESTREAVRYLMDRLNGEDIRFSPENLGLLILRQGLFVVENVLSVWAALIRYWMASPDEGLALVDWFHSAGVAASNMGKGGELLGAVVVLSGAKGKSALADSFVNGDAEKLAESIRSA